MTNHQSKKNNFSKVKVLYIAGPTRSGSTIISNILGQIDGIFHAGEVIEAWDRGRLWKCSCGLFPDACPVWSRIFHNLDEKINDIDRQRIIQLRNRHSKCHKYILRKCLNVKPESIAPSIKTLTRGIELLYQGIQETTGAQLIIDSSKNAGYGFVLSLVKSIDLKMVHLVRDSRAVASSWMKKKQGLWTKTPVKSAFAWNSRNIAAELLKNRLPERYVKVRYEDFLKNPIGILRKILKQHHMGTHSLPFLSSHKVSLNASHGLCGNPDRFSNGVVKLFEDDNWHNLKFRHKVVTTAITWPLLFKYNYTMEKH